MIPDQEIRCIARELDVEPRIVDLDYTLGWALWGMRQHRYLRERLLFKGGTFLRKCWFPGYRFSEDLDFTAIEWFSWDEFGDAVLEAFREVGEITGIDFEAQEPRLGIFDDAYGRESLRFRIYFRGAHPRPTPRSIQLDITRHETVVFEPATRRVHHDYSDGEREPGWNWCCYALEEVLAEKLRVVLGQRSYAIARDLYDIYTLSGRDLDLAAVREALPEKVVARGVDADDISAERILSRRDDFEADWHRNLIPLVPEAEELDFDQVWDATTAFVRRFIPIEPSPSQAGEET